MKKLLLFITTLLIISSCSTDDGNRIPFHIEFLAVDSVHMPESVTPGYEYDVTVYYRKPTDCYYFQGFYYKNEGQEHIIAPQTMVLDVAGCQPLDNIAPEEATFRFTCREDYQYDSYIFKFYTGDDQIGNQSYYSVEVPVEH